jgi:hypothetical protein
MEQRRKYGDLAVILAVSVVLYVGSYLALVEPAGRFIVPVGDNSIPPRYKVPEVLARVARPFYAPAHWLDSRLRYRRWHFPAM